MNNLRWLRVVGDTIFAAGAVLLVLFVAGLATGGSHRPRQVGDAPRPSGAASPAE